MTPEAEALAGRARAMGERVAADAPQRDVLPLVYVSGPVTADPLGCVRQALPPFRALRSIGCVPFLPQLSILAAIVEHADYESWLAYDLDVLARCDALVRLDGHSPGADREQAAAEAWGIPTFHLPTIPDGFAYVLPGSFVEWRDRWAPGWKALAAAIARADERERVIRQADTGSGRP